MDALFSRFAFYDLAILCVALGLFYYLLFHRQKPDGAKLQLPPGKTGWPIIGETLEFATAGRRGTPEKFINDRTSKYSSENLFRTSLIGENLAVFCGASGNKCLFSKENKYVRSWWPRSVKKLIDTPTTLELRGFIQQFVKPEALQQYVTIMDSIARQHLETHWYPYNGQLIKVVPVVKNYTFAVACCLFMSIEDPDRVKQLEAPYNHLAAGIVSMPINFPGTAFHRAIKGVKSIRKQIEAIIIRRRQRGSADDIIPHQDNDPNHVAAKVVDMLSHMLQLNEGNVGPLFENETVIADMIIGLLIASHDTISAAITIVMNYLAQLPHVYDRVLKEQMEIAKSKDQNESSLKWEDIQKMKYSWMVVCEAMRLWPPSPGSFREVIEDFSFSGYTIPKGWKTYWSVFSTHKNPKYFPDPYRFDPSRFEGNNAPAPYTYVPFGGGPRMCPGKEYARIEILIFLHNVVTNYSWRKAIPDEKIAYNHCPEPVNGLPIFIKRHD